MLKTLMMIMTTIIMKKEKKTATTVPTAIGLLEMVMLLSWENPLPHMLRLFSRPGIKKLYWQCAKFSVHIYTLNSLWTFHCSFRGACVGVGALHKQSLVNCHNRQCYLMIHRISRSSPGILVIGGSASSGSRSVEFWSPANPEEGSCKLSDFQREMRYGPTVNLVSGQLVACYEDSCDIYNNRQWKQLTETRSSRINHSSAVKENRILLIGGAESNSTEWISVDSSPSEAGPFEVRHGPGHCTIQPSANLIVLTGGFGTDSYVTEYQLTGNEGNDTPLTPMRQGRAGHACGVYQGAAGQQVRRA